MLWVITFYEMFKATVNVAIGFFKYNIGSFGTILIVISPIIQNIIKWKYNYLISICLIFLGFYFKRMSNNIGNGIEIPLNNERLSHDNGNYIFVNNAQNAALYLKEVEDWLERTGKAKWIKK